MIDAVLKCLNTYSHDDPTFPKLKEWLKPHNFSDGEIDDCLKKLYKDGYVYFMDNEKKNIPSDVMGMYYNRQLNYLISFDGKMFLKTVGGYKEQKALDDLKKQDLIDEKALRNRNDARLIVGTYLAGLAATGLICWEMYKTFWVEHPEFSSAHFGWTHFRFGFVCGVLLSLTLYITTLIKRKQKPK